MRSKTLARAFLAGLLCLTSAAQVMAEPDAWPTTCLSSGASAEDLCEVAQTIRNADGAEVLRLSVGPADATGLRTMAARLPDGLLLSEPVALRLPDAQAAAPVLATLPWLTCVDGHCIAATRADQALLDRIAAAPRVLVSFRDRTGTRFRIAISGGGLLRALDDLQ